MKKFTVACRHYDCYSLTFIEVEASDVEDAKERAIKEYEKTDTYKEDTEEGDTPDIYTILVFNGKVDCVYSEEVG